MNAVHAANCATARAGLALVARRGDVIEIIAARALIEVAAIGRGIAQLGAGTRKDRGRKQRIPCFDPRVVRRIRVGRERAEPQPAIVALGNPVQIEAVDVDDAGGALDILFHQIDQVGAARQIADMVAGPVADRLGDVARTSIIEAVHRPVSLSRTSITASVILL